VGAREERRGEDSTQTCYLPLLTCCFSTSVFRSVPKDLFPHPPPLPHRLYLVSSITHPYFHPWLLPHPLPFPLRTCLSALPSSWTTTTAAAKRRGCQHRRTTSRNISSDSQHSQVLTLALTLVLALVLVLAMHCVWLPVCPLLCDAVLSEQLW
jgi:hypothetical protein